MKKSAIILFTFSSLLFCGQGLVNNGNTIVLGSGSYLVVSGAGIANSTQGSDGSFDNSGTISLQGNWVNNSPNGAFINSGTSGTVILNGSSQQSIGGTAGTGFKNLTLTNSAGALLTSSATLKGTLNVSNGIFNTNGNNFTLLSDALNTARIAPITGDISGNITMQRYMTTSVAGWRVVAAPVTGATLGSWEDNFVMTGFTGATYPMTPFVSVYTYTESAAGNYSIGYLPATNISNPITPGVGYWCYMSAGPVTVDVTGPPVKFNQTFTVSYTPSTGPTDDGYCMLGNPYPSSIDWSSPSWTKTNINNAIYIWNSQLQQYSSWVAGVGTNGGSNIIASSQAFWVQANAASPVLQCNENVKSETDQSFIRPANGVQSHYMNLKLFGNGYSDETYIRFDAGATSQFDPALDARKFPSDNDQVPSLSSIDSSLADMSINSFPLPVSNLSIPLRTTVGASGTYTITGDSLLHMPFGSCLVLEDLVTGIMTDLRTTTSYTFSIDDTTAAPRFLLHLGKPIDVSSIASSCYNFSDGKAIAKGNGSGPWTYNWYNSSNTLISSLPNSVQPDTVLNLSAGVYFVKITDPNSVCGVTTNSVEIGQPELILASFNFLRDTVFLNQNDSLVITNTSSGTAVYSWNFGDGSTPETGFTPGRHGYNTPGVYTVELTAGQGNCFSTFSKTVTVMHLNAVGINENEPALVSTAPVIFPNPSNGRFYIQLQNTLSQNVKLELYSLSGTFVYSQDVNGGITETDVSHLSKGVYIYRLVPGGLGRPINGKLIIE